MTAATVLLDGYSLAVLDIEARRRKISVPELVVSFFDKRCNAPHTTHPAAGSAQGRASRAAGSAQGRASQKAGSAQGRASQKAGSAQGREDRGKTHTEGSHLCLEHLRRVGGENAAAQDNERGAAPNPEGWEGGAE